MLQLNKSQTTNTVAFYPDSPISGSVVQVRFSGSQDYDRNPSTFDGDVISNVANTPWVIAQISGSSLPSASGFYTFDVYELDIALLVWNTTTIDWEDANTQWQEAKSTTTFDLLTTLRAYNSGSDVPEFTQYVSPNENGAYTTYIG